MAPARSGGESDGGPGDRVPAVGAATLPDLPADDRRIHPGEPLGVAMVRITVGQFDRILAGLTDPTADRDEAVHTARKAMKRLRALLRLVRNEIGYPAYRAQNVVLRDTARLLAPARDAVILVEVLDEVTENYAPYLRKRTFAATSDWLQRRRDAAAQRVRGDRQLLVDVVCNLRTARARFASWPLEGPGDGRRTPLRDDYQAIAPGLHRVYRRGRRAMDAAYDSRREADFHDWRKRVKYLRYQLESLELLWPEMITAQEGRLDELGEMLGKEHDLAVLSEVVLASPDACPDARERTLLLAVAYQWRHDLRTAARPLGDTLYGETPDAFVARLGAYWRASR